MSCDACDQVVPFSPASGLLGWVEDTIPVHEYLTGKDKHSGAHKRYRKAADLPFAQCFQAMHKANRSQLRHTFDHVSAVTLFLMCMSLCSSCGCCTAVTSRTHATNWHAPNLAGPGLRRKTLNAFV